MTSEDDIARTVALPDAEWRKSSFSGAVGNCVEVAGLMSGEVAVRHSRHPALPALVFSGDEWSAFLSGVGRGEFGPAAGPATRRR